MGRNKNTYLAHQMRRADMLTKRGQRLQTLAELYGEKCLKCGRTKRLTIDHVVPLSLGGHNGITNLQILCGPCNREKAGVAVDYRPCLPAEMRRRLNPPKPCQRKPVFETEAEAYEAWKQTEARGVVSQFYRHGYCGKYHVRRAPWLRRPPMVETPAVLSTAD